VRNLLVQNAILRVDPVCAQVMGGFSGPDTEDTTIGQGSLRTASSSPGGAFARVAGWPSRDIAGGNLREVEVYVNADVKPLMAEAPSWWPFG